MLYKLILSFCFIALSPLCAMQPGALQPWVQQATSVQVEMMKKMSEEYPINNTTTILDIKNQVHHDQGIPVAHQKMYALFSIPWTLGVIQSRSRLLGDQENVKQVMSEYNTSKLKVMLSLRQAPKTFTLKHFPQQMMQPADGKAEL